MFDAHTPVTCQVAREHVVLWVSIPRVCESIKQLIESLVKNLVYNIVFISVSRRRCSVDRQSYRLSSRYRLATFIAVPHAFLLQFRAAREQQIAREVTRIEG